MRDWVCSYLPLVTLFSLCTVGRSLLGYTVFSYVVNHSDWGWSSAYRLTGTLALTSTATALLLVLSPHSTAHSQSPHKNKHH